MAFIDHYIESHVLLGVWLAFLQLGGFALAAWLVDARSRVASQLGRPVALLVGLACGLVLNFEVFFFFVIALKASPSWGLGLVLVAEMALLIGLAVMARPATANDSAQVLRAQLPALRLSDVLSWLFLAFASIAYALHLSQHIPGVFSMWDAVVSWNRWANEWKDNTAPAFTVLYPQLVPTMIASIYEWLGSSRVEPIARFALLVFPIGTGLLYWDGYRRWRTPAFVFGLAFWLLILTYAIPGESDSGLADVPVAFFVALTGYILLLGSAGKLAVHLALLLGAICASAALLTKQTGGIAWLLWLAFFVFPGFLRRGFTSKRWPKIVAGAGLFLVLSAPWYLYVGWRIWHGTDVTNLGYLTSTIHGDSSYPARIAHALQGPVAHALSGLGSPLAAGAVLTFLIAMGCRTAWGRRMTFGVFLPYLVLWAIYFSYDIRNLVVILPVLCLVVGIGLNETTEFVSRALHFDRWPFLNNINAAAQGTVIASRSKWVLLLAFTAAALWISASRGSVEQLHARLQLESEDPILNRMLIDYASNPGFDGIVFTTYAPMFMIDALKAHVAFGSLKLNPMASRELNEAMKNERPWCEIQALSPSHRDVHYLLIHEPVQKSIIDRALSDGTLRLLFEHGGVRFIRIQCSR